MSLFPPWEQRKSLLENCHHIPHPGNVWPSPELQGWLPITQPAGNIVIKPGAKAGKGTSSPARSGGHLEGPEAAFLKKHIVSADESQGFNILSDSPSQRLHLVVWNAGRALHFQRGLGGMDGTTCCSHPGFPCTE